MTIENFKRNKLADDDRVTGVIMNLITLGRYARHRKTCKLVWMVLDVL